MEDEIHDENNNVAVTTEEQMERRWNMIFCCEYIDNNDINVIKYPNR